MRMLMAALLAVFLLFTNGYSAKADTIRHWGDQSADDSLAFGIAPMVAGPKTGHGYLGICGFLKNEQNAAALKSWIARLLAHEAFGPHLRAVASRNRVNDYRDTTHLCALFALARHQGYIDRWRAGEEIGYSWFDLSDNDETRLLAGVPYDFPGATRKQIETWSELRGAQGERNRFQPLLDERQKILTHVGAGNDKAVIAKYDEVVQERSEYLRYLDRLIALLEVNFRNEVVPEVEKLIERVIPELKGTIESLNGRIKDLQNRIDELERYYNIPPWRFWLVVVIFLLLLLGLIGYGLYRRKEDQKHYDTERTAYEKLTKEELSAAATEAEKSRTHYEQQSARYEEELREKDRTITALKEKVSSILALFGVEDEESLATWQKRHADAVLRLEMIITWLWRTLSLSHAQPLDLAGTGLRYINEPTIFLVKSSVKTGRKSGPREAILPYEDTPRPVDQIIRDLLEYPHARGPALVELDTEEEVKKAA